MNVERDISDLGLKVLRTDRGARGAEARLECPFCSGGNGERKPEGDPPFSINLESGAWRCHKCQERGNLFVLRRRLRGGAHVEQAASGSEPSRRSTRLPTTPLVRPELVDELHRALASADGAAGLTYLRDERRFSDDTIRRFKLGYDAGRNAISIPYFQGGKCIGMKYRLIGQGAPHKYEREKDHVHPLFNVDALDGEYRAVAVTEGELDAVALSQLALGLPAVSLPDGAGMSVRDDIAEALLVFDEVFIVTDQDEKGEEAANKLAERLGRYRCRRVRLPRKDANDCLKAGMNADEMRALFAAASPFGISLVKHISEFCDALLVEESAEQARGTTTHWARVDALLGGWRPGEVTLVTAETGQGKSTWCIAAALLQAEHGRPAFVASPELGQMDVAHKMLAMVAGAARDQLAPAQRIAAVNRLRGLPLYLLSHRGDIAVPRLREEVEYAVRRFGVTFVVIDHLHFVLGLRRRDENERERIDAASHEIVNMSDEFDVHVVLVMHPKQIRPGEDGQSRAPSIGDLKGSSAPGQDADNVARIEALPGNRSAVTFMKIRSEVGRKGRVMFDFDPGSLRFSDRDPNPEERPGRARRHAAMEE